MLRSTVPDVLQPGLSGSGAQKHPRSGTARAGRTGQRHDKIARVIRRLQSDHLLLLELMQPAESARRQRLILLHGLKIALIQRIALLATAIPPFSPQQGVTRDEIMTRLRELDVPAAIELLTRIFPMQEAGADNQGDYGEQSSYHHETALSYAVEHQTVFQPIIRLYELVRLIGSALNHEIGAMGLGNLRTSVQYAASLCAPLPLCCRNFMDR